MVQIRSALAAALVAACGVLAAPVVSANADDADSSVDAVWDDYSKKVNEFAMQNAGRGLFNKAARPSTPAPTCKATSPRPTSSSSTG